MEEHTLQNGRLEVCLAGGPLRIRHMRSGVVLVDGEWRGVRAIRAKRSALPSPFGAGEAIETWFGDGISVRIALCPDIEFALFQPVLINRSDDWLRVKDLELIDVAIRLNCPFEKLKAFGTAGLTSGEEVFILGCNVSQNMRTLGASFGLVDAMRIGPDNGPSWEALKRGPWHGTNRYRPRPCLRPAQDADRTRPAHLLLGRHLGADDGEKRLGSGDPARSRWATYPRFASQPGRPPALKNSACPL